MNNYLYFPPIDSKGRRIGIASGFADYSDNMLTAMKNELSLSMSDTSLRFVRDYYKRNKLGSIKLEELYLLDSIAVSSNQITDNASVYDFFTEDRRLAECYNDIIEKYKSINGENAAPPTLKSLSEVGGLYGKRIGLKPTESSLERDNDDDYAFLLVFPLQTTLEFDKQAAKLFSDERFKQNACSHKFVDERGIAYALSASSDGIYADIYSLPNKAKSPELSDLATEFHGCYIVGCPKALIDYICAACELLNIGCVYFARSFNSRKFMLRTVGRIAAEVDTALIRAIGGCSFNKAFDTDTDWYVKTQKDFAMALMPAIADGAPLFDITLSAHYVFPLYADDTMTRGSCLSAILGVYKAQIELCVPSSTPTIDYKNSASLSAKIECTSNYSFNSDSTEPIDEAFLSLFSFDKKEDGTPDYESLRGMCKKVHSLISSKKALFSTPVLSSLTDSVAKVSELFNIVPSTSLPSIDYSDITGVILLLKSPDASAITLGKVILCKNEEDIQTTNQNIEN